MFLILNIIKIVIFFCWREIEIMKLVGVINWFICWFFVLEGVWLGLIGLIVLVVLIFIGYVNIYNLVNLKLVISLLLFLFLILFVY